MKIENFTPLTHIVLLFLCLFIIFFPIYQQTTAAPEGTYYTRLHGKLSDYYSYISYIRQGGVQWFQTNQYAIGDTTPRWTHAYYLLWGRAGKLFGLSAFDVYYLSMVSAFLVLYVYTAKLVHLLLPPGYRLLAMILILFCGPFPPIAGWSLGPDLTIASVWWTKMDQYNRLTLVPHHFIGVACLVGALYYFLRFLSDPRRRWVWRCLIILSVGTAFYSVPAFIFLAALCFFALFWMLGASAWVKTGKQRTVLTGCFLTILAAIALQGGMYYVYHGAETTWLDPRQWEYEAHRAEQFPTIFPVYLLSFGLLLPLLPFSLVHTIRKRSAPLLFIWLLWFLPLLFYLASVYGLLPVNKLRFVHSAPYVFAGILAVYGIQGMVKMIPSRISVRVMRVMIIVLIGINVAAGFSHYWWSLTQERKPYKNVFIPVENLEAIRYLDGYVPRYTPVMTNWFTGAYVPAFSFMTVYAGHEFSSPDFAQREKTADRFYRGELTADEAKQLLDRHGIVYVLWDMYPPVEVYRSFLTPVFEKKSVILYKVEKSSEL